MIKLRPLYLLLLTASIVTSCVDNKKAKNFNDKTSVDADAIAFIKAANEAGLAEIKASAIAETLSKNPRVKRFAKMMLEDHIETNKELTGLSENKLGDKSDAISPKHQKTIDSLARLNSPGFDKAYITMMVKDHKHAIILFKEAGHDKNYVIQQFAKKTLQTIKIHLDSARVIAKGLK